MPYVGESPSFAQNKNVRKVLLWAMVVTVVLGSIINYQEGKKAQDKEEAEQKARAARMAEKPVVWADPQQIKAPSHKWSDSYPVPSGKFGIAVQKGESAEVVFSDGGYHLLDNYKQVTFGKKSGTFRWRGIDREVVVYVYAAT